MTQTDPSPIARNLGNIPVRVVDRTFPVAGSIRNAASPADTVTHTAPRPARAAAAPTGRSKALTTLPVAGSILTRTAFVEMTHTASSPAAIDDSSWMPLPGMAIVALIDAVAGSTRRSERARQ